MTDLYAVDKMPAPIASDEAMLANAEKTLDQFASVNLDEVVVEMIPVALREFKVIDVPNEATGASIKRRVSTVRHTKIEAYVPMKIYNRVVAAREKMAKQYPQGIPESVMAEWMVDQIVSVWQQTEPDITADTLLDGLQPEQILGLFTRFFGSMVRTSRAKA
jgi:hypothetical protein